MHWCVGALPHMTRLLYFGIDRDQPQGFLFVISLIFTIFKTIDLNK